MNREIKFRAWDWKKMISVWCIAFYKDNTFSINDELELWNKNNLMQYTWLKDKNWKEIYEWDIITICEKPYDVYYENWWFRTNAVFKSSLMYLYENKVETEIIWNIFENKELLTNLK